MEALKFHVELVLNTLISIILRPLHFVGLITVFLFSLELCVCVRVRVCVAILL